MQSEIDRGHGLSRRQAPGVEISVFCAHLDLGTERRRTGCARIVGREDRQHAIRHQLQHVAAGGMNGGDDDLGVIVEKRDELVALDALRQPGVALHVGEPDDGVDAFGCTARDEPVQHAPAGIAPEIGFDQRLGDTRERRRLDGEPKDRNQTVERSDVEIGKATRPSGGPA
jgi:hypothetical protein